MKEALKLALEALEKVVDGWTEAFAGYKYDSDIPSENQFRDEVFAAITAIKEALAQPEQKQNLKLMPREATPEMLKAMDECSTEGYDERLYEGHAGSVYMAAWDAFHGQHCYCGNITNLGVIHRDDGRPCHYPDHKESKPEQYNGKTAPPENWGEISREELIKREIEMLKRIAKAEEALAQPEQERCVGCEACIDTACGRDECPKGWPKAAQPEFTKHEVENADDWSEWVCPDAKGYLIKCCDCGLVHEAEFGVVRYKSETEREDCEPVEDTNLQAVFRMRRSEQWSPEDTAHRAGGLSMAQPEQEPVAWLYIEPNNPHLHVHYDNVDVSQFPYDEWFPVYKSTPQRTWVGLTDEETAELVHRYAFYELTRQIEAKLKEKNT